MRTKISVIESIEIPKMLYGLSCALNAKEGERLDMLEIKFLRMICDMRQVDHVKIECQGEVCW